MRVKITIEEVDDWVVATRNIGTASALTDLHVTLFGATPTEPLTVAGMAAKVRAAIDAGCRGCSCGGDGE